MERVAPRDEPARAIVVVVDHWFALPDDRGNARDHSNGRGRLASLVGLEPVGLADVGAASSNGRRHHRFAVSKKTHCPFVTLVTRLDADAKCRVGHPARAVCDGRVSRLMKSVGNLARTDRLLRDPSHSVRFCNRWRLDPP